MKLKLRVSLWFGPCHLCMEGHLKLRLYLRTVPLTYKKNKYELKYTWSCSGSVSLQDELRIRIKIQNEMDFNFSLLLFFSIKMAQKVEEAMRTMPTMPKLDSESWANSKYHKVCYIYYWKVLKIMLLSNFFGDTFIFFST